MFVSFLTRRLLWLPPVNKVEDVSTVAGALQEAQDAEHRQQGIQMPVLEAVSDPELEEANRLAQLEIDKTAATRYGNGDRVPSCGECVWQEIRGL